MKKLVKINNEDTQSKVFDRYGIKVPINMIYNITDNYYNSSLYFEMYVLDSKFVEL